MIRIAAMVGLVAAPSTFAVGYWQGEHSEPAAAVSTVQINAPVIAKPGAGAASAAEYLAGLNAPPPPPPAPPAVIKASAPVPIGPPPIDIGVQFRNEVSAVRTGSQPHIILAGGRTIAEGQAYRDGWSVRSLTPQTAVLGKGRETRAVNLFSAPPREPTMQVASLAPVFTGPVQLTNGVTAEQRTAALASRLAQMTPEQRRAFMQTPAGRTAMAGMPGGGRGGQGGPQFGQGGQQPWQGGQGRQQGEGGGRGGGDGGGGRGRGGGNQGANGGFGGR